MNSEDTTLFKTNSCASSCCLMFVTSSHNLCHERDDEEDDEHAISKPIDLMPHGYIRNISANYTKFIQETPPSINNDDDEVENQLVWNYTH